MKICNFIRFTALLACLMLCAVSPHLFAGQDPHWSYEGQEGPEHWGDLTEEFETCSKGMNQSPIDIVVDVHSNLPKLEFEYYRTPINEINNGHTIQQNIPPGSFLRIPERNVSFELKQFHFHSPSEHTVNGETYAMEIHFVHADDEGALAVVGVLVKEGEEHPVLSKLWSFMPEHAGETSQQAIGIEETDLLPPTREYFAYSGSLTTPPCSEGVRWIVLKEPVEASATQIATFKERMGSANNRPVQPRNARLILD